MKYNPYPQYKSSGVEWLGDVPEHWVVKRIGHSTYLKGRIGWHGLTADEFIDEGPFCVTGTDFTDGKVNWKTSYHVSNERYQEDPFIHLKEGDLLITKDGSIGKSAVVIGLNDKATLNSGIFLMRPLKQSYSTLFMYWVLNSMVFINFIELYKTGTTISHLYQNVFVRFSLPLPPLPEQQTIAVFLDRETGRIDALVAKKKRLVELLREKRTALISRVVTKGLDLTVKMKPSGVEWLGDVPEHWEVKKTRFIFSFRSGGTPSTEEPDFWNDKIPWVSSKDMKSFYIEDTEDHISEQAVKVSATKVMPANTLLVVMRSGILQHSIPACIITHDMAINQDIKAFLPQFKLSTIYYARLIEGYQKQLLTEWRKEGATVESLDMELIKNFEIPLPPLPEQQAIAAFLDRETGKIDALIAKVETAVEKLKEYRGALISAAVTGKIDVRKC